MRVSLCTEMEVREGLEVILLSFLQKFLIFGCSYFLTLSSTVFWFSTIILKPCFTTHHWPNRFSSFTLDLQTDPSSLSFVCLRTSFLLYHEPLDMSLFNLRVRGVVVSLWTCLFTERFNPLWPYHFSPPHFGNSFASQPLLIH